MKEECIKVAGRILASRKRIEKCLQERDEETPRQRRYITILEVRKGIQEPQREPHRTQGEAGEYIRKLEKLPDRRSEWQR